MQIPGVSPAATWGLAGKGPGSLGRHAAPGLKPGLQRGGTRSPDFSPGILPMQNPGVSPAATWGLAGKGPGSLGRHAAPGLKPGLQG